MMGRLKSDLQLRFLDLTSCLEQEINYHMSELEQDQSDLQEEQVELKKRRAALAQVKTELAKRLSEIGAVQAELEHALSVICDKCVRLHGSKEGYYQRGMKAFFEGDYVVALYDILEFIDAGGKVDSQSLNALGESQHELGLYHDAIGTMSKAIQMDPENEEAYLSRAMAYFEAGDFKKSLEDYLIYIKKSGFVSLQYDSEFSAGFQEGLKAGLIEGVGVIPALGAEVLQRIKAVPAFLADTYLGAIAFAEDPIKMSTAMAKATNSLVASIKEIRMADVGEALVPEVMQLTKEWNILDQRERAKQIGGIIGKYGTEALTLTGSVKLVRAARKFKRVTAIEVIESARKARSYLATRKAARIWWNETKVVIDKMVADGEPRIGAKLAKLLRKKELSERQLRKALKRASINLLPRPKGLPKGVKVKLSKKSAGFTYVKKGTTSDESIVIRVMPGNPNSGNIAQRKPYVVQRRGRMALDALGSEVSPRSAEVHIPLSEYKFKGW